MIVKGTKQLGSFKRGINLYIPKKSISEPEPPPPLTASFAYNSGGNEVGTVFGDIPDSWQVGNEVASVSIGTSVTIIGNFAFQVNQISSLTIPNSVTSIGNYAFRLNGLTNLVLGNNLVSIGNYAFGLNNLSSLTIPISVTSIGSLAFCYNPYLALINCYTTLTSIGTDAFFITTSPLIIHARASDATWTEGTGLSIGGNSDVTVIKDL